MPGQISADFISGEILSNRKISYAEQLLGVKELRSPWSEDHHSLPPVLEASFQANSSNSDQVSDFETLSLALRSRVFGLSPPESTGFPSWANPANEPEVVLSTTVEEGLKQAAVAIQLGKNETIGAAAFKLVGAVIDGDLDLSKLDIPFSVRLICCHVKGSLILDRSRLVTLDLSGTIVDGGISGNYAVISGALRARRMVSLGPVDLGGASVEATLDLTDAIMFHENEPSSKSSFVADRGILNLSLSTVSKDVRLSRGRFYGGLNFRGAHIGGMLHMNDAVLRCPLAHFEIIMQSAASKLVDSGQMAPSWTDLDAPTPSIASIEADQDLARLLHPKKGSESASLTKFKRNVEILGGFKSVGRIWKEGSEPRLFRLLRASLQIAECALRMESAVIGGPIYAFSMRVSGRMRMKSLKTGGGVSFNGSRFRTVRSIRRDVDWICQQLKRFESSWSSAGDTSARLLDLLIREQANDASGLSTSSQVFSREYAIDLRDAEIEGPLDLGKDMRSPRLTKQCDKALLETIARSLCGTGEDPYKFYWPLSSDAGRSIQSANRTEITAPHAPSDKTLHDGLRKIGAGYDVKHYEFLDTLEHSQRILGTRKDQMDRAQQELKKLTTKAVPKDELERARKALKGATRDWRSACSVFVEELNKFPHDDSYEIGSGRLAEGQVEAVVDHAAQHGTLNSTLLLGEIRLVNAKIGGSLSFSGVVANVFDRPRSRERVWEERYEDLGSDKDDVINMANVTVAGTLDFRNSVGLSSVNASEARISGDAVFCDGPNYSRQVMRYLPLRGRAMFPKSESKYFRLVFRGARIQGEARLLFDRETGPRIDLNGANIAGELQILPAKYALQMHEKHFFERFGREPNKIAVGSRKITFAWQTLRSAMSSNRRLPGRVQDVLYEGMDRSQKEPPHIDLSNVECDSIVHPPASWPNADSLLVTGLRYNRTHPIGPIAPEWRSWPDATADLQANYEKRLVSLCAIFLVIAPIAFASYAMWSWWNGGGWIDKNVGSMTAILAVTLLCSACLAFLLTRFIRPARSAARPLALWWLRLQRRHFRTSRIFFASHPHEPYLQASRILRGEGRIRASEELEIARLKERTRAMSWRSNGPLKAVFRLLDWFFGYGFRPARGALIVGAYFVLAAFVFHWAEIIGVIVYVGPEQAQEFHSAWYTIDTFFPFAVVLGGNDWQLENPQRGRSIELFFHFVLLVRFIGWSLITLIALAIATRVEAMFVKADDFR